jgi:hypothetical protein
VAVAETAGSVGSGGRLAGESWEYDGSVTELRTGEGDVGKVTLPPVFFMGPGRAVDLRSVYRT